MTVMAMYETSSQRSWAPGANSLVCLEDKYEVIKEVGDGSFGSVALARVRSSNTVARRNTMVAVKTMKKTFDSFNHCLELREVIFLQRLPPHQHLVPALDVFLDPYTKKLHIAMEYMDGNLYQLMKARDRKYLDAQSVKSILFQILSGLEHIHEYSFFHRDIKPENILVSTSAPQDTTSTFKRYSALVTPPTTPPAYTVKIADFGLARETHSKLPYTTYVSTRWYRAPEVLLRAGEYSAPVDIWAVGAMAVEIATLKPLFPGSNEVDQVWRVCEIMGSPGNWVNKQGHKVGGGEWKDGVKLASKLGFTFPKMAPHSLDTILVQPTWPAALSDFVTWCLMWDPKNRPNSSQALAHEYFRDAVDPLRRPKSSSKLLGRKQSSAGMLDANKENEPTSKGGKTASWLRRSIVQREISAPAVTQHAPPVQAAPQPIPLQTTPMEPSNTLKPRPNANKRATWTHGMNDKGAPMLILPSIRPVSPLSDTVTAQAEMPQVQESVTTKLASGHRTLDSNQMDIDAGATSHSGLASPTSSQKESFFSFSHLRKRARRFSAKYPLSPEDDEPNVNNQHWSNNRHSQVLNNTSNAHSNNGPAYSELDKALNGPRPSWELPMPGGLAAPMISNVKQEQNLKRHHSTGGKAHSSANPKLRKAQAKASNPNLKYETPNEADELLDEALVSARTAANQLDFKTESKPANNYLTPERSSSNQYLNTPGQSANGTGLGSTFGTYQTNGKQVEVRYPTQTPHQTSWPTPPYDQPQREENWDSMSNWALSTINNMFNTDSSFSSSTHL